MPLCRQKLRFFGPFRLTLLRGVDEKSHTLADVRGPKGTLVVFICNHPFAAKHGFTFPYVIDETQEVARAYDAQCTPDFFGFNAQDALQYRGRLDASRMQPVANTRRDLFEAMKQIAVTGHGPEAQLPSMGCSIKWKQ